MPKVGGKRKKTRTHKEIEDDEKQPRAFIFKRGDVCGGIRQLVTDYRDLMYPFSSMKLQESDKTSLKEYKKAAGYYQVSHMVIFTGGYVRFVKNPNGPTITFKILSYSNRKEILQIQRKFRSFSRQFSGALLVMSGFNDGQQESEVAGSMIQSMFASINVKKGNECKRVVLFNKDQKGNIYLRHYQMIMDIYGIDRKIKRIIKTKNPPDLGQYNSFNDYLGNKGMDSCQSESEGEQVNEKQQLKLHEVGPRMTLRLHKIEEGVLQGRVLYHRLINKSKLELSKQKRRLWHLRKEKERRKQVQDGNVERKKVKKNPEQQQQVQ